jgi:hypothetical protein
MKPVLFLLISSTLVGAVENPKVSTYELDVSFYPETASMEGHAFVRFEPAEVDPRTLTFFLHGELFVESIHAGGHSLDVKQDQVLYDFDYSLVATRVRVELQGKSLENGLNVTYSGSFNPSAARSPSDYMRIDSDGVFLRAYGYSLWFPTFLEAERDSYPVSFSKVTLRTPLDFETVFVGRKVAEREESDQRVTEWVAEGVDLFAAQCTAQRYSVTAHGGYFLYHHEDDASRQAAERILLFAKQLNAFYKNVYKKEADAPQFHIMEMPRYGDISSGNVVGINSELWTELDETSYPARVLAHELVHPFVHVYTDRSDPLAALAVEGFPSYFHLPIMAELLGEDYYQSYMRRTEERYLQKKASGVDRRGDPLPPEKPLLEIGEDEIGTYKDLFLLSDRALLFFDYLRRQMGHDLFFAFTRDLFNRKELDLRTFEATVLEYLPEAGEDLDLWLRSTEYPEEVRLVPFQPVSPRSGRGFVLTAPTPEAPAPKLEIVGTGLVPRELTR